MRDTMTMLTVIVIFLIIVRQKRVASVDTDASGCPQYVTEGASLYCECRAINVGNVQNLPVASWPGQSANYQLSLTNVRREQNGTEFTCQVTLGDETKTTVYVMQVAYGPMDETVTILGPDVFPTDGSKNLILTCEATEVNPIPEFSWSGAICDEGNNGRTCTFRPDAPGDDGKRVSCRVTNRNTTPNPTIGETMFSLNLTYPPTTVPVIAGYTEGQLPKTGDILTCTVTGGKPPVSAVLFQCSSPKLPDQEDVVVGSSVSSSLTIDTSQATEGNALCLCEAVWEPDFTLYRLTTTPTLQIEYKASVLRFSINGSTDHVTMHESDNADVELKCATTGRPRPSITLERQGDANALKQTDSGDELSFNILNVTCERMGTYTCIADNGYPNPSQMSVRLIVYCSPRHTNTSRSAANRDAPPKLSSDGLNVTIVSSPVPNAFTFSFHGSESSNPGQVVSSGMFSTTCIQSDVEDYLVTCQVKAYDVRAEDFGVYSMTLDNGLGGLEYFFSVQMTVSSNTTQKIHDDHSTTSVGVIVGGVVGGVAVLVAVAVVVIFTWRRAKPTARRQSDRDAYTNLQHRGPTNSSESRLTQMVGQSEETNMGYDNTLTETERPSHFSQQRAVNYANTEPRPDLRGDGESYQNVETASSFYTDVYDPVQTGAVENAHTYTSLTVRRSADLTPCHEDVDSRSPDYELPLN